MNRTMKRIGQATLAMAAFGAVAAVAVPEADAARRASMAQNLLILDKNDVYLFPQVGVEYTNLLSLEYGPAAGAGSGIALLGDESMAFGLGIYRGDIVDDHFFPYGLGHNNLGNIPNILGYAQPHTIVDLFASMDLGGGLAGARLTLANGANRLVDAENEVTSDGQTYVGLTAGYSMVGDMRLDAGLRFGLATGGDQVADESATAQTGFALGLGVRGFSGLSDAVDLGFLFDAEFQSTSITVFGDPDDFNASSNQFHVLGGIGPAYDIDGVTTLAGYAVLGLQRSTDDPDTSEDLNRTHNMILVIPGVHVAADIQILEWLYFRTGMQYNFGSESETVEIDLDTARDSVVTSGRLSNFGWRTGIGLEIDNFTLDGAFQAGFITNGPDFLGGNGGGMFTMVSAGYRF